jgi:hypothetical protein
VLFYPLSVSSIFKPQHADFICHVPHGCPVVTGISETERTVLRFAYIKRLIIFPKDVDTRPPN